MNIDPWAGLFLMINRKILSIFLAAIVVVGLIFFALFSQKCFWYFSIFDPEKIYKPLTNENISIAKKNKYILSYRHSYKGLYLIELFLDRPPPYMTAIKTSAKLSINIKSSQGGHKVISNADWREKFGSDKHGGVILGSYRVPRDIALNGTVYLTVKVLVGDSSFATQYGNATMVVKRAGDF